MKKTDVKIGHTYAARVSGKLAWVLITRESPVGGWDAINHQTGRIVHIKSAQRLRYERSEQRPADVGEVK